MYQERTRSIQISVEPFYVDEQSAPEQNRFVFGYRVQITNEGSETVQLISRQWMITDGHGLSIPFQVESARRHNLLHGLDDIALTLQHADEIACYERTRGMQPV